MFGFGKVENTGVTFKYVEAPHFLSFRRCIGVIIQHIIVVSPLVRPFFLFSQDAVGFKFSADPFYTTVVFVSNGLWVASFVVSLTTIMFTSHELLIVLIVVVFIFLT